MMDALLQSGDRSLEAGMQIVRQIQNTDAGEHSTTTILRNCKRLIRDAQRRQAKVEFGDNPSNARREFQEAIDALFEQITVFLAAQEAQCAANMGFDSQDLPQWQQGFRNLCSQLAASMFEQTAETAPGLAIILEKWLHNVRSRPARVKQLFRKHADVWGVTCQQSAAGRFELYEDEFDCVIIDEAARTSPLDLLIPLVRARRIVMVGDHMQLPHMLDYQLEREFESAAATSDHLSILKDSLFANLYDQLPRSKRIRLRTQYRMNPVIGDMVSSVFYMDSPLKNAPSTADLVNDTGLFDGKSLVWLSVSSPYPDKGLEQGQYYNLTEVECIVKLVRKFIDASRHYSIGVITFYAQQRDQLTEQIHGLGLEARERVKVGSVDSFQGQQREVIVLSMVRSNPQSRIGFLESPNRLNVSMSRARRLLVIVGDPKTVTASTKIKAIFEYCQQVNGVLS